MAAQCMTDYSPAGAAEVEASAAGSAASTVSQAISSPGACSPEVTSDTCFEVPSMMPNPSACDPAQVSHENRSLLEGWSCVRKRSRLSREGRICQSGYSRQNKLDGSILGVRHDDAYSAKQVNYRHLNTALPQTLCWSTRQTLSAEPQCNLL